MRHNRKGEIATIIMLGTLAIIGVVSIISSVALKKSQTTQTKAAGQKNCAYKDYDECSITFNCTNCQQCDDYTYECVGTSQQGQTSPVSTTSGLCECTDKGQPNDPGICGDANPCGAESSSAGSCTYGQWKDNCAESNENCPSDAGLTYTYWCDKDGKWRFQYPNCVIWCKSAYLTQAPKQTEICSGKDPGTELPNYAEGKPSGIVKGSDVGISDFSYASCDGNIGAYVEMRAFCDQFGQVQWGPARRSDKVCGGATKPKPQNYTVPKAWQTPPPTSKLKLTPIIFKNTTTSSQKKDGTENAICGPGSGCNSDLFCDKSTGAYGYGVCKVASTTISPAVTSSVSSPPISSPSLNGYCPNAQGPGVAYCSKDMPAAGWKSTWMSCRNFWDICWVPGPGSKQGDKTALYPSPVPETWTVEIDDGFASWSDWITHSQVCDVVAEKSLIEKSISSGIVNSQNGFITKNCRDPEYLPGSVPKKVLLKYTKNSGIKTMLCQFGGVGKCVDLP